MTERQWLITIWASLKKQGRFAEADEFYQRALAISRKISGENDPDTILHANNVAANLCFQGRYAEALSMFAAAAQGFQTARLRVSSSGLGRADFTATYSPYSRLAALQARLGKPAEESGRASNKTSPAACSTI